MDFETFFAKAPKPLLLIPPTERAVPDLTTVRRTRERAE